MSEIERIHNDINEGYTVTRFGDTMTLHNQMVDDIKYLHNLATNNDALGDVSGWIRFDNNHALYDRESKHNCRLLFDNGEECDYDDNHPWAKLTHFKPSDR